MDPVLVLVVVALSAALAAGAAAVLVRGGRAPGAGHERALREAVEALRAVGHEQLDAAARTTAAELDVRNGRIGEQLAELAGRLDRVSALVHDSEREGAERLGRLDERLAEATRSTTLLGEATSTLREALSATASRGQWGERLADDVLRAAGMVEGVSYRRQQQAGRGRPDVTFLLPGDRVLHMDVKFPLDNYLRHLESDDDQARERHAAAFVRDVDERARELTTRQYVDPAGGTLDYVLLFVPNEHVYAFAHEQDPALVDRALARRVVLCSPLTLFAVLAVVRQAAESHALEQRSGEVLALLGEVRDQWGRVTEQLDKMGRGLDSTRAAYEELQGVRRRGVERRLDRIDDLTRSVDEPATARGHLQVERSTEVA